MKIQIDTEYKTIKVTEPIKLSDLIKELEEMFPKTELEKYSIIPDITERWLNPIPFSPTYPSTPWITAPWITSTCKLLP